jgi:flagellar hook protein FlgE
MIGTILSGISVAMKALDLISNNVANAKSYGFKTSGLSFQDVYQEGGEPQRRVGEGAKLASVKVRHERQGNLTLTGNVMDLAIKGAGYFVVSDDKATTAKYTRDGSFSLDGRGFVVNSSGLFLRDVNGKPIQIPQKYQGAALSNLNVSENGTVIAVFEGQKPLELARIALATFENPGALRPEGGGDFTASFESGAAKIGNPGSLGYGNLQSGALENSTSDIVKELTRMLAVQQSFSANAKMLQTHNDMTGRWLK